MSGISRVAVAVTVGVLAVVLVGISGSASAQSAPSGPTGTAPSVSPGDIVGAWTYTKGSIGPSCPKHPLAGGQCWESPFRKLALTVTGGAGGSYVGTVVEMVEDEYPGRCMPDPPWKLFEAKYFRMERSQAVPQGRALYLATWWPDFPEEGVDVCGEVRRWEEKCTYSCSLSLHREGGSLVLSLRGPYIGMGGGNIGLVWTRGASTSSPPTKPATPGAADTVAPKVKALPSKGKAGTKVALRYKASDNSGKTSDTVAVYKAGKRIWGWSSKLQTASASKTYAAYWPAPLALKGQTLIFCVAANDAAGNASEGSCARVKLT